MNISQIDEYRYQFAGMAMQAILSNPKTMEALSTVADVAEQDPIKSPEGVAVLAAAYAEALIDELNKRDGKRKNTHTQA